MRTDGMLSRTLSRTLKSLNTSGNPGPPQKDDVVPGDTSIASIASTTSGPRAPKSPPATYAVTFDRCRVRALLRGKVSTRGTLYVL